MFDERGAHMKKEDKPAGAVQFLEVKEKYKDFIIFFRMGEFYEFYYDDAITVSQELEITLYYLREDSEEDKIPKCGFNYKSLDRFVTKLVNRGYKIAICEQVSKAKASKGLVEREVVQLITPGTIMHEENLDAKFNNYIASIDSISVNEFVISYSDLSTGEFFVTRINGGFRDVLSELFNLDIKEVVLDNHFKIEFQKQMKEMLNCTLSYEDNIHIPNEFKGLLKNLEADKLNNTVDTIGRLLNYLISTQKSSLGHLQAIEYYEVDKYLNIDVYSKRNLELFETSRTNNKKGSLLSILDSTKTSIGARRLKQWIERPLLNRNEIEDRHSMVECLLDNYFERKEITTLLSNVYDLERLSGRISAGNVNAKDLIQLKRSLKTIPNITDIVLSLNNDALTKRFNNVNNCSSLYNLLERGIKDDASHSTPNSIKEGNIINDGYDETLDTYRKVLSDEQTWIEEFKAKEQAATGIKNLKVSCSKNGNYFIEISKKHLDLIDNSRYRIKQAGTKYLERYTTDELEEKERLILEANEKTVDLEYNLFLEIREEVKKYIPNLQELSKIISDLDVLQSFAEVSESNSYIKPTFSLNRTLNIKGGRHPVIEQTSSKSSYIKNDCLMNNDERNSLLITGPNMSGKSTYMRQVALIVVMAQMGCFVPADYAELPLFDHIFTRIGAADDLVSGQSTFMVEMLETQYALSNATSDSLILLDEIGRGTSTYDGVSLAQSIIEYIHDNIGAKTFFSTHYRELLHLENDLKGLKNVRVTVREEEDKLTFLHKIEDGASEKSYGINIAKIAGMSDKLVNRAKELLINFEKNTNDNVSNIPVEFNDNKKREEIIINETEKNVLEKLKHINILEVSPMESFKILNELNTLLKEKHSN